MVGFSQNRAVAHCIPKLHSAKRVAVFDVTVNGDVRHTPISASEVLILFHLQVATPAFSVGTGLHLFFRQVLVTSFALVMKRLLKHDFVMFFILWVMALIAPLRLSPRHPDILTIFVIVMTTPAEEFVLVRMLFMSEFHRPFSFLFIPLVIEQDQIEISRI